MSAEERRQEQDASFDRSAFRLVIESAPVGILVCDEHARILLASRKIASIFGYTPGDLTELSASQLLPPAHWPPSSPENAIAGDPGESSATTASARRQDGTEMSVDVRWNVVETDDGRLSVAWVVEHSESEPSATESVALPRGAGRAGTPRVVAESPATRLVLEQIDSVAPTMATVLLLGETGAGKEVFAQAIHRSSTRHARPMITVNCGAIPAALIESELFGRERGAYTGALARQIGRFEMANGSTLFLDEIGDLPLEAQVKLLRVLQERVIERLGGGQPIKVDVRIIAATNRNLEQAVADRTFREDLFYRLNVFPITVPPLRDRIEDIPALVWSFVDEYSTSLRRPIESISKESLGALQRYAWPGNVRELRNVIERSMILATGPRLIMEPPVGLLGPAPSLKSTRLADIETDEIRKVLQSVGWRVRGRGGAAEILGLKPNTLDSRMAKLGIRRPSAPPRS
jgi:PAS domain S-box-containing protein